MYDQANYLFNQAIELGNNYAAACLGKLYYFGTGYERDYEKAFELFKKAAEALENPSGDAMNMLSKCYRHGFGTPQDIKKAEYWLNKAQETGSDEANMIKQLLGR